MAPMQELWTVHASGIRDAISPGVQGTITGRDVIRHSLTILRFWGPSCYLRCLRAAVSKQPSTFLSVLYARS
jgi:hypothetical protein